MITKIQIKSVIGSILFEYESKDNSVKKTIIEAVNNCANLRGANLQDANLRGANLQDADLVDANLQDADLVDANLRGANLQGANLRFADLVGANLRGANLQGANLQDANLRGAKLRGANLQGAKNIDLVIAKTRILPEGDIIGWKKCMNNVIVKLLIPSNAKRSSAFGRKCRAEFAKVIEVFGAEKGISSNDKNFFYIPGETIYPDSFDENWEDECSNGIHFFITRIEAENYLV